MATVTDGRAAYNLSRTGSGSCVEIRTMKDHEKAVAAFLEQAARERPAEFQRAARHVVLTDRQLDYAREQELYAFGPGELDADDGDGEDFSGADAKPSLPDMYGVASLQNTRRQTDRQRRARELGDPIPYVTSSWEN